MFELKPIQRLQICTASENEAARRVAEKCGFVFEGTMRKAYFARGKYLLIKTTRQYKNKKLSEFRILRELIFYRFYQRYLNYKEISLKSINKSSYIPTLILSLKV
jgi:hypothetical protein